MVKPKVGLIVLAQPYYLAEWYYRAPIEPLVERVLKALREAGMDVLTCERYVLDEKAATAIAEDFASKDVDALIYLVSTWILSDQVYNPVLKTGLPFIVWSIPEAIRSSVVGGSVVKGGLDDMGVRFKWVVGFPEDVEAIHEVLAFSKSAAAVKKMRRSRVGVIGYVTMQMYTAAVDFAEVKRIFGVSITHFDTDELIKEAEKIPIDEAEEVYEDIARRFRKIEPQKDFMVKALRIYLACKKIAKENDLSLIGVKCHPSPLVDYGMLPCLANTLINDENEVVFLCENDLNAGLTMLLEHYITESPTILADLGCINKERNTIKLFNCGSAASYFAGGSENTTLKHQYEWVGKGVASEYTFKLGKVTIARLGKIDGRYVMHIATGEVIPTEKEVPRWPEGEIKLDGDVKEFMKNVVSNHYHMVFGNIKDELIEACKMLSIRPIIS